MGDRDRVGNGCHCTFMPVCTVRVNVSKRKKTYLCFMLNKTKWVRQQLGAWMAESDLHSPQR